MKNFYTRAAAITALCVSSISLASAQTTVVVPPPPDFAAHAAVGAQYKEKQRFEILKDDASVRLTLRRWTIDAGYALVWEADADLPVQPVVYVADDILDAVNQLLDDARFSSSYPLVACAYNNNVIRIVHISNSCARK